MHDPLATASSFQFHLSISYSYFEERQPAVVNSDGTVNGDQLNESIRAMNYGEILHIKATDPAFQEDVKSWCEGGACFRRIR